MRGIEGEQVLLRIIVSEDQNARMEIAISRAPRASAERRTGRRHGVQGVAGFGHDRALHTTAIEVAAQAYPWSSKSWIPRSTSIASCPSWMPSWLAASS